jgi:hypothetical protein
MHKTKVIEIIPVTNMANYNKIYFRKIQSVSVGYTTLFSMSFSIYAWMYKIAELTLIHVHTLKYSSTKAYAYIIDS